MKHRNVLSVIFLAVPVACGIAGMFYDKKAGETIAVIVIFVSWCALFWAFTKVEDMYLERIKELYKKIEDK